MGCFTTDITLVSLTNRGRVIRAERLVETDPASVLEGIGVQDKRALAFRMANVASHLTSAM